MTWASAPTTARAHDGASDLSAVSALPIALSVTAPSVLVGGGSGLIVVAIEASAEGTVWVLERASDGARTSVRMSAQAAGAASVTVGAAIMVSAVAAGWVLHASGKAIGIIPNQRGRRLMHHARITP